MKRTNVVLDEQLVARAKRLTRIKTTRKLLDRALRELIQLEEQREVLKLYGRIQWIENLNRLRGR